MFSPRSLLRISRPGRATAGSSSTTTTRSSEPKKPSVWSQRLVAAAPIQLLIASRLRPTWVSARRILYDEVLELNQTTLAMDASEASEVLAGRSPPSASGLVALANGWPAVIGLASVTTAEIEDQRAATRGALSVLRRGGLRSTRRRGEGWSGDPRSCSHSRPRTGDGVARRASRERVWSPRLASAFSSSAARTSSLHPLARSFLEDRCAQIGFVPEPDSVARCLAYYRRRRDWDAAFDVVVRNRHVDATRAALDSRRSMSSYVPLGCRRLRAGVKSVQDLGLDGPALSLARSEVALRQGRLLGGADVRRSRGRRTQTSSSARCQSPGRAAHLASRERRST